MPVFNKQEYVENALRSAIEQDFPLFEIVVVNDGSTDGSGDICQRVARNNPKVRYFEQENQGVIAARNYAIERAVGEFILPLDADDVIFPGCIQKMFDHISAGYGDVIYSFVARSEDKNDLMTPAAVELPSFLVKNCVFNSAMFKKSDWAAVGGYSAYMKSGLEDWEFWLKLLQAGKRFYMVKDVLIHWRHVAGSRNQFSAKIKTNLMRTIMKNHSELYRPYKQKNMMYIAYRFISFLKFIPWFKKLRQELKIYAVIKKYD